MSLLLIVSSHATKTHRAPRSVTKSLSFSAAC
jgi:hypothetical protein